MLPLTTSRHLHSRHSPDINVRFAVADITVEEPDLDEPFFTYYRGEEATMLRSVFSKTL